MGSGRRVTARLAAIALAMVLAAPWARANPGCSPGDLLNGLENALGSITSPACAAACSDGVGCGIAVALTAVLGGVSADAGQGEVTNICNAVNNVLSTANNAQSDANSVSSALQQVGASSQVIQQISGAIGTATGALGIASCACSLEQGVGSLGNDVGACIQDALCSLDALIGDPCTCTAPPPIQDNCAIAANACGYFDQSQACQGAGTILHGPVGYTPVTQIDRPNGTFVSTGGNSSDGNGHCSPVQFCFCPKPMVAKWLTDYARDSSGQFQIFSCQCPTGTHAAGAVGGAPVCLCDKTNLPPNPPNSFLGMCPPPTCPSGQVMIGQKCVAACAKTDVMLPDGKCCNPAQVTSCGECCPAGQSPDPGTGSCVRGISPAPVLTPHPIQR